MSHIAKLMIALFGVLVPLALFALPSAAASDTSGFITQVAKDWDNAAFAMKDGPKQAAALQELKAQLSAKLTEEPQNAAARAWRGIVLATEANSLSGLSALQKADSARKELEKAIGQNPDPTGDGYALAILGALYDAAPGFPVGFGDKKKALQNLKRALDLNPSSIDANYFLAAFYANHGDVDGAKKALATAKNAPSRPGREIGDAGRQKDIQDLLIDLAAKRR